MEIAALLFVLKGLMAHHALRHQPGKGFIQIKIANF